MPNGTVKWFNMRKGYGFIEPETENEKDVFVHISAVKNAGLDNLNDGDKLSYELENKNRIGVSFGHISNANIGDKNPGVEILSFSIQVPFD